MSDARKRSIKGRRFGRLVVSNQIIEKLHGRIVWHCLCDCGVSCIRPGDQLLRFKKLGRRQSCGCWRDELTAERRRAAFTHGLTRKGVTYPRLYDVWRQMLQRCENPKHKDYPAYGGRGIFVCVAWHDPHAFIKWCINSGYQEGLTIERRNVNGHYWPSNCTWVPNSLQSRNSRKNRVLRFDGRQMCISEWSVYLGIHVQTLLGRLRHGWTIEQTLSTTPVRGRNQFS